MAISQNWSGKLVGEYRLLRRLGGGSFGEVYQAENVREHSQVAIKLIKAPLTQREDLKAFLNEARSMRLRHPHIVPLLDFGLSEEQDLPFLVMEYVSGGTLRDRYPKESRVPLETVANLTTQLASALQYAHDRHLIHRDVKPENMLCRTDGTVLLSDFGIASVAHASSSASAYQSFGGTLPYMAPEQHAGRPRPASDQYALAVVVYEWLVGARPFVGTVPELVSQHLHAPPPSLLDQVPTLPAQVEQVIFKALSKQPQERFARIDDFAVALQTASQSPVTSSSQAFSSLPLTTPQVIEPSEIRGNISLSAPSSTSSLVRTEADQPLPLEVAPTLRSSDDTTPAEEGLDSTMLPMLAPVPHPAQYRKTLNRRVLFIFGLMLLVVFSGSGLFYLGFRFQRTPTFSPSQAATATVTAATHAYATGTAKQGVMFGFDAAHTHYNPYEQTIGPGNVSRLTSLWSFANISSTPAVAGGMVYVNSEDSKLYAFDANCLRRLRLFASRSWWHGLHRR